MARDFKTRPTVNGTGVVLDNDPVKQATETLVGGAEIATQWETDSGTDNQRIVTPAKLKPRIDSRAPSTAPFVNLMPDSGRFAGKVNPLALYLTDNELSTGIQLPFTNPNEFFLRYNGTQVAEGGRFLHNNTNNGGTAGVMTEDVQDLLVKMGRTLGTAMSRYGSEFVIASYTMGTGTGAGITFGDGIYRPLMTVNNNLAMFSFANMGTVTFWIRLKSAATPGNLLGQNPSGPVKRNAAVVSGQQYFSVEDGWTHYHYQMTGGIGYNTAFPQLYAQQAGDVVQIALPAFFPGATDPGRHNAPLPTVNELLRL